MPDSLDGMADETARKVLRRKPKKRIIVGWREWIALPEFGIDRLKAKIDTGARTSALHAYRVRPFRRGSKRYVRFYVHPVQRRRKPEVLCEARVVDERVITSSNGQQETRFVVTTTLKVGKRKWPIELTLTNRDEMSFRMLLGRQALRRHAIVDPGSSYRLTRKTKKKIAVSRDKKIME